MNLQGPSDPDENKVILLCDQKTGHDGKHAQLESHEAVEHYYLVFPEKEWPTIQNNILHDSEGNSDGRLGQIVRENDHWRWNG